MAPETTAENEAFFFKWRIENYNSYHEESVSSLKSPSFTMGILEKTKWHLSLYPRGRKDDFIVCYLYRENDLGPVSIKINTQFSLLIDGERYEFNVNTKSYLKTDCSIHKLMKRETLLLKKPLFLPGDVLTIHLCIWKDDSQVPMIEPTPAIKELVACLHNDNELQLPDSIYTTAGAEVLDLRKKLYPYLNECSARTRIGTENVSFMWLIKNFSLLKGNMVVSVPLEPVCEKVPSLILSATLINYDDIQITITKMAGKCFGNIFVTCRFAVMDIGGNENIFAEEEHHFDSPTENEDWVFESFFKQSKMIERKVKFLPDDILSLKCTFTFSTGIEISTIDECNFVSLGCKKSSNNNDTGFLADNLNTFYADKKLFDINLRVGGISFPLMNFRFGAKDLPAHKAVLASRSPVFRAMFENDTLEKNTTTMEILDIDNNTLTHVIAFMYSDNAGNLTPESAIKLYAAAAKYQINVLRKKCSEFLISNISSENVHSILVLADLHQDLKMKRAAEDFLFTPPYDELFSFGFDNLMQNHMGLARETLQRWVRKLKLELLLESKKNEEKVDKVLSYLPVEKKIFQTYEYLKKI